MAETAAQSEKLRDLDRVDRGMLNLLAENARTRLIAMARKTGLSIDAIRKRLVRLEKDIITKYTIQVNTEALGLNMAVHVYVKLKNETKERYQHFISYLMKDHRVIDLMSMLGDYDVYIVILAKNVAELDKIKLEIKQQFSDLIADWKEVLVTHIYKLEEYKF